MVSKNILLEGLNQFHGVNLVLNSDEDQDTFGKVTKHKKTQHTHNSGTTWYILIKCCIRVHVNID